MTLRFCDYCRRVVKYQATTTEEGGYRITNIVCPNCGTTKRITTNKTHYGNDAINK
jgi:RNase P subunit RPR2